MGKSKLFLGIESSCDETAAALVRSDKEILSNVVFDQLDLHAAFGGVVPEIAARAHAERLDLVTAQALQEAGCGLADVDGIAVTAGPGLIGGVMSGVVFAKALAAASGKPLFGINHLAGHALSPRLSDDLAFPFLLLLVSGGHCQFLLVSGPTEFTRLGGTIDDAPGEAFDKSARLMGLGYPGGPLIEQAAAQGDAERFSFPRPLLDREGCDMSFSGLKTALRREVDRLAAKQGGLYRQDISDLSAAFQTAVADVLRIKTARAISAAMNQNPVTALAVAGGVAANQTLRAVLEGVAQDAQIGFAAPPLSLCTDNGAMIAWAALERAALGEGGDDPASIVARPRWPLDTNATPLLGSGKKGSKA